MDVKWCPCSEETLSYDSLNHYKVSGMWWPCNKGDRREEFANKFSTILGFFLRMNKDQGKFADKHKMDEVLCGIGIANWWRRALGK